MNPVFPWPPAPPMPDASEEERVLYRDQSERYRRAFHEWDTAMHKHNRWWKQLIRWFLPWRESYEIVCVHDFWGPEFTTGTAFTQTYYPGPGGV